MFEIRLIKESDLESCRRICYEAFKSIADRHQFRPDFPSHEAGIQLAQALYSSSYVFGVVAESEGPKTGRSLIDPGRSEQNA